MPDLSLFPSRKIIYEANSEFGLVKVSEQNDIGHIRCLHLDNDYVQSAMNMAAPNELALPYSQAMFAFLLFHDAPKHCLVAGLGGGSLVKFLYQHFPATVTTVIEINPVIIDVAQHYFFLPENIQRLNIVQADAAEYIPQQTNVDCIILDAFDTTFQIEILASLAFYQQCADALAPSGVLCVNLWSEHPDFEIYLSRLSSIFNQRILCLPVRKPGNYLVFAFREQPEHRNFAERAQELETNLGLPFVDFLARIKNLPINSWAFTSA
ncbi:MAG: fused MFS/spermidine synthase [Sulfuriferula sp.]